MKLYGNISYIYLITAWVRYKLNKPLANISTDTRIEDYFIRMSSGRLMNFNFLYFKNGQYYYNYVNYIGMKKFKDFGLFEFIKFCRNN